MLKNHPRIKKILRFVLSTLITFACYLLLNGILFGVDAGYRLPDYEDVMQIEVYSSDAQRVRIQSKTFTESHNITVTCALLALYCDYEVVYMGVEDIPRLTVVMTLEDGSTYEVIVGNNSVSFDGTFKGLRNKNAAEILTQELLLG